MRTTARPDGTYLVLFDGHCAFCRAQYQRLLALAKPHAITARDFQQPGALDDLPGLDHETCMRAMALVAPDGAITTGAEAVATALATRPWLKPALWLYRIPPFTQIADRLYAAIARRRYRLMRPTCDGDVCTLHEP